MPNNVVLTQKLLQNGNGITLSYAGNGTVTIKVNINHLRIWRPFTESATHLIVQTASSSNYADATTVIDTKNVSADRTKVLAATGLGFISCPANGLGSAFSGQTILVDLSSVSNPTFIRYAWSSSAGLGDWQYTHFYSAGGAYAYNDFVRKSMINVANGVAGLDADGKIPSGLLPPMSGGGDSPAAPENIIEQLAELPTLTSDDVGRIALYTGENNGAYIKNRLYKAIFDGTPGPIEVTGVTYGAQGTYAYSEGSGDSRRWWRRDGSTEYNIFYTQGAWYIHSFEWEYDGIHQNIYRAEAPSGSNPWDSNITWTSTWMGEWGDEGIGGPAPTLSGSGSNMHLWRPVLPICETLTGNTVTIHPGGVYECRQGTSYTLNIAGYAGCYGDAEIIIERNTGVTITPGQGLALIDTPAEGKESYCLVKFKNNTARLFVLRALDII